MGLQADTEGFTSLAFGGEQGARPGDENLFVQFYHHPKQHMQKSEEAGRPIFEDREYIKIRVPGQKGNMPDRPVTSIERERFAAQYGKFKAGATQVVEGTRLEQWPGLTRSQCEELKFFNLETVEQLATLSDTNAQAFMGISGLRTRAKLFLEASSGNAQNEKLASESLAKDERIAALEATVSDMAAQMKEIQSGDAVSDSRGDSKRRRSGSGAKSGA